MKWFPRKEPCKSDSAENPQVLFNTTCWGIGKACYNAMKMGSVHNYHMTSVESKSQDIFIVKFKKAAGVTHANKYETDWMNMPHIKDSVFVGVMPQNLEKKKCKMAQSILLPQNEQFYVTDSLWVNLDNSPVFKGCSKCWTLAKWRQGAHTYRFAGLKFINVTRRINVFKKDIYWDLDGSLTGEPDSYTSWADAFNLQHPGCNYTQVLFNQSEDGTFEETTWYSYEDKITDAKSIFFTNPGIFQHRVRNHTFMTCTTPIRKLNIAWPEPQEVHLRELIVLNQDTGLWQPHEYEKLELYGWAFPVVANQRLEVRPDFLGMDLTQAGVNWAFADLMQQKESNALKAKKVAEPEWLQLGLGFWFDYDHVKLLSPYSWYVGTRYGETAELAALSNEEYKPYLSTPEPLETPENLPSMTHGMKDKKHWAMNFRFPIPAGNSWEEQPLSGHLEARKCPDEGCLKGLPDRQQNWSHYTLWSEKFGDMTGQAVEIVKEDWIMFDMDIQLLENITIFGKLSFDDSQDRILQAGNILIWGVMEIGTPERPFGLETKKQAMIKLKGYVLDTEAYVYVEEQTLWNKVIAVPGTLTTFGAPIQETWLRLAKTIEATDESGCVTNTTGPLDWPAGSEVIFSVTEFDDPWNQAKSRSLTQDPVYDEENDCWRIHWSGNLGERRFASDVPVNDAGKTVPLKAAVARIDRSIVFESASIDTTGGSMYGGHIEVFDVQLGDLLGSSVVGDLSLQYTRFHKLGKGALSAAVKVTYSSNFDPPPVLIFHGNSWTESLEYPLHLESSNVPTLITNNVMYLSLNGGIFSQQGSSAVQIKENCIIGVNIATTAPRMTLQNEDQIVVPQYAGIRLDELPVRMLGNLVSASRDMGYLTPAEPCPPRAIFNNEAHGNIIGVYLLTQRGSQCQTSNLWTVWKAAHVGIYLSDFAAPQTVISDVVVSDCHMGILPYMSIGSAFRRIYIRNSVIMGTSPAGTNCDKSAWCRTQTLTDPYMNECNSMYIGAELRRVGFVAAIQTANKKSCWMTMPYAACRLMSTAQPKLNDCHQPYEKDIHMQKGLDAPLAS